AVSKLCMEFNVSCQGFETMLTHLLSPNGPWIAIASYIILAHFVKLAKVRQVVRKRRSGYRTIYVYYHA
ncbi:TPA: hypothetical protein ACQDGC_001617, partial [Legionella pneumophila]